MKTFLKKNFAIVLAFALPVVFVVLVALSVYLPSFFLSTNYNFVYAICMDGTNYYSSQCEKFIQNQYVVENGTLVIREADVAQDSDGDGVPDSPENYKIHFFLHDTEKNESREISEREAQALQLNDFLTSPDGVTISNYYDRGADFFLFGGGSSYGFYLTKGRNKTKLNLINYRDRYYYRDDIQFIGWVLPGRN